MLGASNTLSHRRYNPLLDQWIIIAENRIKRPWQGATEAVNASVSREGPSHQKNALAPGGLRASGEITPDYQATFIFPNDFPSLTDDGGKVSQPIELNETGLFKRQTVRGICRVICYHPDSNLQMSQMSLMQIEDVIDAWIDQINELQHKYVWIQIFENKGAMVGCSNVHPHGQLWASDFLPTLPAKCYATQKAYYERTGRIMLMDVLQYEMECGERIVTSNDSWVVIVPYWACWPFETMILPKKHVMSLNEITKDEKKLLAQIIQILLVKYDNLFKCPFPFSMGWEGAPTGRYLNENRKFWTLHAVYFPPLLRSATVKKFMAGYELISEPQRDITPEKVHLINVKHIRLLNCAC
ncbi:unnamed protein product [Thelazia callipaeda]|uniref:Galactose-1-phosphate uridylyltransferase n=1 Tax=Thelazia callipaeda TaxID=103827 RepID=A0A0N5DBQ5_THECL|nr:unnamed protein product [Thelazia callipaeda]